MTATKPLVTDVRIRPAATRFGYMVAIIVNAAMLVVANNILDWGWLPFLTDDFGRLLWIIDFSLLASIVVNAIYLGYDPAWFKSACQIGLGGISLAVAIRMFQVFPFDFSGYQFNWEPLTRFVIFLAIVGTGIAIVSEVAKLARGSSSKPQLRTQSPLANEIEATGARNDRQQQS